MNQQSEPLGRPSREPLRGPRGLPLIGSMLQIDLNRLHRQLCDWADRYGPIYPVTLGRRRLLVISDPETMHDVLRRRPDTFRRTSVTQRAMREMGVDGVFNAEGADWRRQRKLVMHALNPDHLRGHFARIEHVTARLQQRWERAARAGAAVDLRADLMRFTVDVTSGLAFGRDLDTLSDAGDDIQQHLNRIFPALVRRIFAPVPWWRYFKLPSDRELDRSIAEVGRLASNMIVASRARLESQASGSGPPASFLDAMIVTQERGVESFSDREILGNVLTILLAGEDTTANTLAWTIYLMMQHAGVQQRLQDEADRVLGPASRPVSYAMAGDLPYTEAVANEAMRMRPVAPLILVESLADVELLGVPVTRGSTLALLPIQVANHADNFRAPGEFRPERWIEADGADSEGPHNPRAFLPFGGGPRYCPGRHLAMLEIRMVMAMLCRNFDVVAEPGGPRVDEVFSFTMHPSQVLVRLRLRDGSPARGGQPAQG